MNAGAATAQDIDPRQLIGSPEPADWRLAPLSHAEALDEKAVALKRVLESEAIAEIMRRQERHDAAAGEQQATYKRYGRLEIYFGAAAAILGAIVLMSSGTASSMPLAEPLRLVLLVVQVLCTAGLLSVKYLLKHAQPFLKWQQERAAAETARVELFETVCGLTGRKWRDAEQPGDFPLLRLQLEYFVRYQLLVQLKYYGERGAEHAKAAGRYVSGGAILTFGAVFAAGAAGFSPNLGNMIGLASLAALIAPVLLNAQTSLSRLNQDERNAARYAITFEHLDRLRGRLDEVREKARAGLEEPVHAFIRSVNEIISVEHSEWLTQQSSQQARLEAAAETD